jgi:hypothetical protein
VCLFQFPTVGENVKEHIPGKRCQPLRSRLASVLCPAFAVSAWIRTFYSNFFNASYVIVRGKANQDCLRYPSQLKPIGYNWSYLACRIGHKVPFWQLTIGSSFHLRTVGLCGPTLKFCLLLEWVPIYGRQNRVHLHLIMHAKKDESIDLIKCVYSDTPELIHALMCTDRFD